VRLIEEHWDGIIAWHRSRISNGQHRLEQRLFGKRILFTNRDWPVPEVVAAYRSHSDAESGFGQLKDPTWCRSAPCTTSPTPKSVSTSSTVSWPWPSLT
jgi:hypothetical protein